MENTLNTALTGLIIAIVPILATFLANVLRLQAKKIKEENKGTQQEQLNKYIDLATDTVIDVVKAVAQTTVDTLKKNGEFTKEKQEEAFNTAKKEIVSILSEDAKKALQEAYGDVNAWLETRIEAEVKNLKKSDNQQ